MRSRTIIVLGALLTLIGVSWASAGAVATTPVTLNSGYVTDTAGVLTPDEVDAANDRLSTLAQQGNGDLFVVYVDEFSSPSGAVEWANQTATDNGLGDAQYLIAVAVDSRQYALSASANGPLSTGQMDAIENAFTAELANDNWAGAITAAADAFPGPSMFGWVLLALVVIAAVIALIIFLRKRAATRKRGAQPAVPDPNDPFSTVTDAELEKKAGLAIVAADDAVTSSKEELGFAVAQFGDESTAQFTEVVAAAKSKLDEAFSIKQQLDDEVPDSIQQRRAWHIRIIQLCDEADDLLDANIAAFEELRKLEANAPQVLAQLSPRREKVAQQLATSPQVLNNLSSKYDASALATVTENPAQAQQRLALADAEIAEATSEISAGKTGEAAFSIRTAEQALIQAEQLIGAVTTLDANLTAIEQKSQATIADVQNDLQLALTLPDPQGSIARTVDQVRIQTEQSLRALQATPRNPQAILDALETANGTIDTAVAQGRSAAEAAERSARALDQRLLQAQAQISAASDYITTRRGAVDATARTRLSQAQSAYSEAITYQVSTPQLALERASRAYSLASDALSIAQNDVSLWGTSDGYVGRNTGYSGGAGSDLLGSIVGGMIGGLFSGGGGGGGGGSWGGGGGGWRSSGGSSRGTSYRPSSFGGGGSSRGASRGGRF